MTDYSALVTSEHNQKPHYMAMVDLVANGIGGIVAALQAMPEDFDIDAATGAQLDIVGEWVGQSRDIPNVVTTAYFGFADTPGAAGFGDTGNPGVGGPFYDLGTTPGSTAVLDDGTYRTVLRAKIISNNFNGTLAELEAALALVTGVSFGICDPGTQLVTIVMGAAVTAIIQALITGVDLLPRAAGVAYLPLFPVPSWIWTVAGSATASGTTAQKATGTAGWDSSAYDATTYSPIYIGWTCANTAHNLMGGLSSSPASGVGPNIYSVLNYAIYEEGGTVGIYESGASIGTFGTYAVGDKFAVYSDGANIVYLHNGVILRVRSVAAGSYAAMFAFYDAGAIANNIAIAVG